MERRERSVERRRERGECGGREVSVEGSVEGRRERGECGGEEGER